MVSGEKEFAVLAALLGGGRQNRDPAGGKIPPCRTKERTGRINIKSRARKDFSPVTKGGRQPFQRSRI